MSRFDGNADSLRRSLAWHATVTTEMQRRLVEAEKYVRTHSGDPRLLAILSRKGETDDTEQTDGPTSGHLF